MTNENNVFALHNCDVRKLPELLSNESCTEKFIDVTVTSPPYFDMKSYGYKNQIGHGQEYLQYLSDLKEIFKQIYLVTKDTGSLWIIVDTFNKNGNLINLPFDISKILENLFENTDDNAGKINNGTYEKRGWKLTDIVIWKKDKTLPWSKNGQFRNIFEYILFFTKSDGFRFYIDRTKILDFSELKEWWEDFPERYSPKGAVPTNVWEYPIPTQGHWSVKTLRHFNPLPIKLIERILLLTTDQNDVVFDPFAGSGTVLGVADFLKRKWFGFEMNQKYCMMFERVKEEIRQEMSVGNHRNDNLELLREKFEQTIKNLRLVKYPKILMRQLDRKGTLGHPDLFIGTVFALSSDFRKDEKTTARIPSYKLMAENVFLILNDKVETESLNLQVNTIVSQPPLSKFGIEATVILTNRGEFVEQQKKTLEEMNMWLYSSGVVRKFERPMTFSEWLSESEKPHWKNYVRNGVPPIISNVRVFQEASKTWVSKKEQLENTKKRVNQIIGSVSKDIDP